MRKVFGGLGLAAVVLLAGFGSTWSVQPAEAAGASSWFDTNVFQRGCRAHQPDCAHNWVP